MNWLHIDGTTKLHSLLFTCSSGRVWPQGVGRWRTPADLLAESHQPAGQSGGAQGCKCTSKPGLPTRPGVSSRHLSVSEMKFKHPSPQSYFSEAKIFCKINLHHSCLLHILNYFYFHWSSLFFTIYMMTKHQIILFLNICLSLTGFSKKCWTKPLFFLHKK